MESYKLVGTLTRPDGTTDDLTLTFESKALLEAFIHGQGHVDSTVADLFATLVGQFEDAGSARNWGDRGKIYANNALRKIQLDNFHKWMKGESI